MVWSAHHWPPRRKRTSSGLDGVEDLDALGVEDVDAVDVERNIGCARLGRAIHAARGAAATGRLADRPTANHYQHSLRQTPICGY